MCAILKCFSKHTPLWWELFELHERGAVSGSVVTFLYAVISKLTRAEVIQWEEPLETQQVVGCEHVTRYQENSCCP